MKRVYTKPGDVFSVQIDENTKKYMQYIANDLTQLNSDVIRAFKKSYPIGTDFELSEIINDEVDFYAHCVLNIGVKLGYWEKIGTSKDIGKTEKILFRDTNDYGHKRGEEPIKISYNWYVWHINDETFTRIGKLDGKYRDSYNGIVINPLGIIELLKGNKYPVNFPDYE